MISIKFLLVTSLRYKTGLLWELGTWSHRFFNTFSLSLFSFFAWPWKIWVRDKTRPTAYLKRKLPCWGSLEKNTNNRWHLRRVSDYIVVSAQLRLISKKEERGREEPEILGFSPFSETFSTLKTQTPRRRHLELPKRCWLKTYVRLSIELNKIHHYLCVHHLLVGWIIKEHKKLALSSLHRALSIKEEVLLNREHPTCQLRTER